jgi:hypothetical protein
MSEEMVQQQASALAVIDLEQYAGEGMQEVSVRDMSIPFLKILQDLSPEVKKSKNEYIEGAEVGMICNTVTNDLHQAVSIVPCYFNFVVNEWRPNRGGYVATHQDGTAGLEAAKKANPTHDFVDTANWYVLINGNAGWSWGVIAFTSTQLKYSRKMMTRLQSIKMQGKNGEFTPPIFAHIINASTTLETKDNNEWFSWKLELSDKKTPDIEGLFQKAKEYCEQVKKGAVKAVPPVENTGESDVY